MHSRIADIYGKGIATMFLQNWHKVLLNLSKSVIPAPAFPPVSTAHHWLANAILVGVQFLETIGFGADITVAKNIQAITPDGEYLPFACGDLQSAGCFTEWTSCVADLCSSHGANL